MSSNDIVSGKKHNSRDTKETNCQDRPLIKQNEPKGEEKSGNTNDPSGLIFRCGCNYVVRADAETLVDIVSHTRACTKEPETITEYVKTHSTKCYWCGQRWGNKKICNHERVCKSNLQ